MSFPFADHRRSWWVTVPPPLKPARLSSPSFSLAVWGGWELVKQQGSPCSIQMTSSSVLCKQYVSAFLVCRWQTHLNEEHQAKAKSNQDRGYNKIDVLWRTCLFYNITQIVGLACSFELCFGYPNTHHGKQWPLYLWLASKLELPIGKHLCWGLLSVKTSWG